MKFTRFTKPGSLLSNRFARKVMVGICLTGALSMVWGTPAAARDDDDHGWVKTVETLTLNSFEVNGCNGGEGVEMVGQAEIETRTMTDGNGILHIKQRIHFIAQGVGQTSGATYYLEDITNSMVTTGDPFPVFFVEMRVSRLIGVGVPDQIIQYKTILHANAQGEITTDIFGFKFHCGQ